ncbi:MAG: FtsQ-type POTRA domain-containing protein [Victivallales bacterium]|jgi:cell division septal protein FtsQ|nr:FtsQ-type POTRA domain-containing protein [Victivallales bacterium]
MATKFANTEKLPLKNAVPQRSDRVKLLRALLVLFVLMALTWALVYGFIVLRRVLFTENPRFQMRDISVQTAGYWQNRAAVLAYRLGIHLNDNLFAMDLGQLRRRLEKIPNVETCEITRILPDTLHVRIVERIPRAILSNPGGRFVVDQYGVVIPRRESMTNRLTQLPVIFGFRNRTVTPGQKFEELDQVLELIMQTTLNFPDIKIIAVNMSNHPAKTEVTMRFRDQKLCRALFPAKNRNTATLLTALQSAILHAERRGDTRGTFDLSFDSNVIVR